MPLNGNPCQTHASHAFMTLEERITALESGSAVGSVSASVSWADVTDKPAEFPPETHAHDYAASTHNHDAAYSAAGHTHPYEPADANIQAHLAAAHAPSNAQKNSDITKAEIEAKLTGEISSHSHASSGSDPWTYLRLANDFTTTSATAVDVTGLGFTPAANQRYEFVGRLMVRTATATVGPRPGIAWATGLNDGVAFIQQTSSATANVFANGNITAAVLAPVGGVPTTTGSWPALIEGQAMAGATPSGTIRVQLASETAGTTVTMKAGSFLKYRTVP
jgi:hypothetical protein